MKPCTGSSATELSDFSDGRSEASPVSEKPKPTSTQCDRRMALSVKKNQDRPVACGQQDTERR